MNKNRSLVGPWSGLRGWVVGCGVLGTVLALAGCREAEGEGRLGSKDREVAAPTPLPIPDLQPLLTRLQTYDGARDLSAEMRIIATRAGGRSEQIDLRLQRRIDPGASRTFLQVVSPPQERDKVLLAIEEADKPTVAFSYLAGLRRLARLSSSRQLTFREAKVTVQELLGMELSGYQAGTPERVDDEGTARLRLRLTEIPDRGLAFPRIDLYLAEEELEPVRFELFDAGGALQKRIQVEEIRTIQSRQTLTKLSVEDLGQQLQMSLEIRRVEYDRGLPESAFTEERLKQVTTEAGRQIDARREAP